MRGRTVRTASNASPGITAWQYALARWLAGAALLWICLCASGGAAAQTKAAPGTTQPGSTVRQQLLAQQLQPNDPARYAWGRAAESLGQGADATYLQLALMDDWLLALEGQPAQAARSIEAAIAHGQQLDPYFLERRARAVWRTILQSQQLRPEWDRDGPGVSLPPELEALGAELTAEGPGLWVRRAKDGRPRGLYLWLGVRNRLAEPLPLPEFTLRLGRADQQPAALLMMQCALPRYSTRQWVPPQTVQHYLCSAVDGGVGNPPAGVGWLAQTGHWFSEGAALQTVIPQSDQALSRTIRILREVDNPAMDKFMHRVRESAEIQDLQQRQAQAAATAAKKAKQADESAKARRAAEPMAPWLKRLLFWGGVIGALVVYGLVAHHVSVAVASWLMWTGLAIPCAILVRSLWGESSGDGWSRLGTAVISGIAIGAPFLGTLIAYLAYKLVVSPQARLKAVIFLLVVALLAVLNTLERWYRG
ncbi:MAG: hypothetical protein ACK4HJ_19730 [Acidovorax sp.]